MDKMLIRTYNYCPRESFCYFCTLYFFKKNLFEIDIFCHCGIAPDRIGEL